MVSIHASVKDATQAMELFQNRDLVSIHASVKDATKAFLRASGFRSFNPRICKRCDQLTGALQVVQGVSIHASVKDATGLEVQLTKTQAVSIHASVKDATL